MKITTKTNNSITIYNNNKVNKNNTRDNDGKHWTITLGSQPKMFKDKQFSRNDNHNNNDNKQTIS